MADTKDNPPPAPASSLVGSSPGFSRMDTGSSYGRPAPRARARRPRVKDRASDRAMVRSFINLHVQRQQQLQKGQP